MKFRLSKNNQRAILAIELIGVAIIGLSVGLGYMFGKSLLIIFLTGAVAVIAVCKTLETENNM